MSHYLIKRVVVEALVEGTDLYVEIARIATENGISAGRVTGSGSVRRARMTTFDQKIMQRAAVEVHFPMEIVSLYGEVVVLQGKSTPHIHVVLADDYGNGKGGYLVPDSTPIVKCEITIEEYNTDGTGISAKILERFKNQLSDAVV